MSSGTLQEIIRRLRGTAGAAGVTDAQLLERFTSRGDQGAFELLLWRHAGAVLGTIPRQIGQLRPIDKFARYQCRYSTDCK